MGCLAGASQAQYTSSGHLVYVVGSTLFAVPFDLDRLDLRGTPTPLPIQIATTRSGAAEFAIGRDSTLAYLPADTNARAPRTLVWVDRFASPVTNVSGMHRKDLNCRALRAATRSS